MSYSVTVAIEEYLTGNERNSLAITVPGQLSAVCWTSPFDVIVLSLRNQSVLSMDDKYFSLRLFHVSTGTMSLGQWPLRVISKVDLWSSLTRMKCETVQKGTWRWVRSGPVNRAQGNLRFVFVVSVKRPVIPVIWIAKFITNTLKF